MLCLATLVETITQFIDQVKVKLISQLIKGISRGYPKIVLIISMVLLF